MLRTYIHMHVHAYMHACIQTYVRTCIRTYKLCIHTSVPVSVCYFAAKRLWLLPLPYPEHHRP